MSGEFEGEEVLVPAGSLGEREGERCRAFVGMGMSDENGHVREYSVVPLTAWAWRSEYTGGSPARRRCPKMERTPVGLSPGSSHISLLDLFPVLIVCSGLFFIGRSVVSGVRTVFVVNPRRSRWRKTRGTVVDVHVVSGKRHLRKHPVYEFVDLSGVRRRVTAEVANSRAVVGSTTQLRLDPENPGHAVVLDRGADVRGLVGICVFGAFWIVVGLFIIGGPALVFGSNVIEL